MGAVYRATDTKLNREVAIKVLPDGFAADPDRLARFTREAQVLASLNHPNIATIFGVEDKALVMELIEGHDLAGPLPLNEALNIARQIAEGLEAAHDKGIIHRDLKPANIKVTPEGVVKVLDFGLAKATDSAPTGNSADSPTITMRATQAGLIMGTAGYMSPEQAVGKTVDKRADIWAFGVVLHELLTGKRLVHGETVSHTLAAVLKDPIDFAIPQAPKLIQNLLARCLDRNLKQRLQDPQGGVGGWLCWFLLIWVGEVILNGDAGFADGGRQPFWGLLVGRFHEHRLLLRRPFAHGSSRRLPRARPPGGSEF